ncbi:EamA family transporter [Allorhizobium sp. NPDC080224]|uniref:EamA family transporter n=1 Tax=Allorhizobium sp. NPDC080224 TaxID=3390547 RepID=UPI003D02CDD1
MEKYLFIAATLILTAYGQLVVKARSIAMIGKGPSTRTDYLVAMFTDPGVISGLVAAVVASACWTLAIQRTSLGVAYPFMALTFVIVPIGSVLLFGERLSMLQVIGMVTIVAGVTVSAIGA